LGKFKSDPVVEFQFLIMFFVYLIESTKNRRIVHWIYQGFKEEGTRT